MDYIAVPIVLSSPAQSNAFLRCLWAQLRGSFGELCWLFQPSRDGRAREILMGTAQLGRDSHLRVSARYRERGVISEILFKPEMGKEIDRGIAEIVRQCIAKSQQLYSTPEKATRLGLLNLMPRVSFHRYS
jgi:hypothetical protein